MASLAQHAFQLTPDNEGDGESFRKRPHYGSCVCACVYDPVSKLGGINHFMLPDGMDDSAMPTRYGVNAMEMLINEIPKLGGDRRRLEGKAFGVAHAMAGAGLSPDVPRKHAKFIKGFLQTEGIPPVSSRLGGSAPVEIMFATETGKALARALGVAIAKVLASEEGRFDPEIRKTRTRVPDGSVELFEEKLMPARPMPVVMVSSLTERGAAARVRAMELGAVDFATKPRIDLRTGTLDLADEIVRKVKHAARAHPRKLSPHTAAPVRGHGASVLQTGPCSRARTR